MFIVKYNNGMSSKIRSHRGRRFPESRVETLIWYFLIFTSNKISIRTVAPILNYSNPNLLIFCFISPILLSGIVTFVLWNRFTVIVGLFTSNIFPTTTIPHKYTTTQKVVSFKIIFPFSLLTLLIFITSSI